MSDLSYVVALLKSKNWGLYVENRTLYGQSLDVSFEGPAEEMILSNMQRFTI